MGNFDFVVERWPQVGDPAMRAENYLRADPRAAATYARRAGEIFTAWIYAAENLPRPYDTSFSNLTQQAPFREAVGNQVWASLKIVRLIGNDAVHKEDDLTLPRARSALEQLHLVCVWMHHCYGDPTSADPSSFSFDSVPPAPAVTILRARADLERIQAEFDSARAQLTEAQALGAQTQAQVEDLRAQLAELKAANSVRRIAEATSDPLSASEAETRTRLIDLQLAEAGWSLSEDRDREYEVSGIPSPSGRGRVDYLLWGDDGLPLAVIEAKRTRRDAREGRLQGEIYADALERDFNQRPLIFYTNGYEIWFWDDRRYPPRRVSGFFTKDELKLIVQRRTSLKPLTAVEVDRAIVERPYQLRAIRAVNEAFEASRRRALLVMATGTGKTRTVIALADVLQRASWVKRVLFLADRTALVRQAVGAFKAHLPSSAPVNLVSDRDSDGRVFISTYQTIMGLIDSGDNAQRRFGPGYFDLIVVDEAHRSIYNRYGEIFDYFDAMVVGLTATPRADIDHNTYRLFELEDGIPTDAYELEDAISAGYLVPPVARVLELGFMNNGIRYLDLSDAERAEWDALEWQDGEIPDEIDAAAVNRWLFNADTVDKVLEALISEGRHVEGGNVLGKTIVFAKNQRHAEFIQLRFDANFPEHKGHFAEIITHASGTYAQTLIDDFSTPNRLPQIAISVDMLDTGIDVPDVVNLVFFKPVHSQTKYWQMMGRGTRLRPNLYGPGRDKEDFVVFDVCGNIDFFNADVPELVGSRLPSVSERVFSARLRLLALLAGRDGEHDEALRGTTASTLRAAVDGMNRSNFLVRKHLRAVDWLSSATAWDEFSLADVDIASELVGLPTSTDTETDEFAQRFDLLVLEAQVAVVEGVPIPLKLVSRVIDIAWALSELRGIPAIQAQSSLLDALVVPEWWAAASLSDLERVRVHLRSLMRLIGPSGQAPIYSDFVDTIAVNAGIAVNKIAPGLTRRAFRERVLAFLLDHDDNLALHKLRTGRQLSEADLSELQAILVGAGSGLVEVAQLDSQVTEAGGLGRFIRSIMGLERSAVEAMLGDFVAGPGITQSQHAFVDLIIDQLTFAGQLDPTRLYEDPFTDIAAHGPDSLFDDAQVTDLIARLRDFDESADPRESTGA